MARHVSFTNTYRVVFVAGEAFFRQLDRLFIKETGEVQYSVNLENGRTIDCDTLEDILGLHNVGDSAINEISVSGWGEPTKIFLSLNQHSASLFLRISTTEKNIDYLQQTIEDIIYSAEAPFARYASLAWFHFLILFEVVYFLWLTVPVGLFFLQGGHADTNPHFEGGLLAESLLQSAMVQASIYTLASVAAWAKEQLYPNGSFLIGNGITRYEALGKRRTFVFTVLFGLLTLSIGFLLQR